MSHERFERTLRQLIAGELPIEHDRNEYVGHADVVRQLLAVAPAAIRDDLGYLHDLLAGARDATGAAVLGIFPRMTDPELANVEGRISDYVAESCGIRFGDGRYEAGRLVGESRCRGWPGIGSPLTNNRYPYLLDTSASNYFSNRFWCGEGGPPGFIPVPAGGRVVFRGEYLRARYFAFHPSDFDTNTLPTLVDEDLDPDPGSVNPYREKVPPGAGRRFTAQLVFTPPPERPEPNTTYVGLKRNGEPNPAVFNILRTTDSVLGAMPPNSTGVLLPSVTVQDADGNQTAHFPECDPYPPGIEPPVETTHFAPLPIPDHRGLVRPGCFDTKSNWGLPYDLLASDDIQYLGAPYSRRWGEVFVVRAKAFTAPHTPDEPVFTPGKEIRGYTVTTYNFWAGICNAAVVDHEVVLDEDGWFTLLVSTREDRPRNATPEHGVTWLDWGPYLDGQLTFRFLIRRNPLLVKLRQAVDGGEVPPEIAPYLPRAAHCTRQDYEEGGWAAALAAEGGGAC
jgi:hypothetical protein